jgi:hypothetical protein
MSETFRNFTTIGKETIDVTRLVIGPSSGTYVKFNFYANLNTQDDPHKLTDIVWDGWTDKDMEEKHYQEIIDFCQKKIEEKRNAISEKQKPEGSGDQHSARRSGW